MASSRQEQLRQPKDNCFTEIRCRKEHEKIDVLKVLQANQPNQSSLKILRLSCRDCISDDCAILIAKVLEINKSIIELELGLDHLARHGVDIQGAMIIALSLKRNTTLQHLSLINNMIEDDGAVAIVDAIKGNDALSLNSLNLKFNCIGIDSAISIAAMLVTDSSLIELDISQNLMIGSEGVVMIAEALKRNKTLAKLILDWIRFGEDGARSIAVLLTTNVSLMEIGMNMCHVGDAGIIAISDALKTNKSLERLSIRFNHISSHVITNELAPMLAINTTLKELCLCDENDPPDNVVAGAGAILETLQDNNDTVYVLLNVELDLGNEILGKIRSISEDNRKGIRLAPKKAERSRRNILNDVQCRWSREST